jgi:hypothetical protein
MTPCSLGTIYKAAFFHKLELHTMKSWNLVKFFVPTGADDFLRKTPYVAITALSTQDNKTNCDTSIPVADGLIERAAVKITI